MKLIVTKRSNDFHASIAAKAGTPAFWAVGKTQYEAVANLVLDHSEYFGVEEVIVHDYPWTRMHTSNGFLSAFDETFYIEFFQLEDNEGLPEVVRLGRAGGITVEQPNILIFEQAGLSEMGGDPRDTRFSINCGDQHFILSAKHVRAIYNSDREMKWENSGINGIRVD